MEAKLQINQSITPSTRLRVYVQTWGCQMNEYDSAKMADVLGQSHGAVTVLNPEEADILLLNTCSVREKAQEKLFSQLGRWKDLKADRPELIIGVGGCVASQEGAAILGRAPFVDLIFGPQTLHRLPELLEQARSTRRPALDISFPEIEKFDRLPAPRAEGPSAYVSIMEGCSKYCTFCVVPYTRGEEISRPLDDVIAEVAQLAEQGVREVTLLGQNVNAYRGPAHDGSTADLALLVNFLAEIDGIERIRYTTSHPLEFSDSLIQAYADVPKLANQLHLPVQSGSDRILGMMKRGYTAAHYLERIRRLRDVRPGISISTDFIIGFPTETEADFQATMNLIENVRFDNAYSFLYSKRPGTPAAMLVDNVTQEEKERRLQLLQARINELAHGYSAQMVGSVQRVLVERPSTKRAAQLAGRCENGRWVNIDVKGHDPVQLIGKFADIRITEAMPNSLRGCLLTVEAHAPASRTA